MDFSDFSDFLSNIKRTAKKEMSCILDALIAITEIAMEFVTSQRT